jgi:AcrR family transcriptional regulator
VPRPAPAYTRLDVDERRRRLLALGADLFTRHAYDELSMSAIAREAGISKALLYHYFPSKQAFFQATLEQAAAELAERIRPADHLPPAQQLSQGLDAFLGWIEENQTAYRKLMQSVASVTEARELVDRVRYETADLILAGLSDDPPPSCARP